VSKPEFFLNQFQDRTGRETEERWRGEGFRFMNVEYSNPIATFGQQSRSQKAGGGSAKNDDIIVL
jgi:hypothetical protein